MRPWTMVVDPFSAASKPMPDWESMPSRPLPFAATLEALDLSGPEPTTPRLPRFVRPIRRERDELPVAFPTPVYSPARAGGPSNMGGAHRRSSYGSAEQDIGSDEWMQRKVGECVDNAICELDISGCGLTTLSTKIADLRDLVTLQHQSPTGSPMHLRSLPQASTSPPRSPSLRRLRERPFARAQSAPASADLFAGQGRRSTLQARGLLPPPVIEEQSAGSDQTVSGSRLFGRSRTGAVTLGEQVEGSRPNLAVYLARNLLTSLPSALFEIRNITVLTLRGNRLESLPAAIGTLVHLKELNISNNSIAYLPASITNLHLDQFTAHPNKWKEAPLAGAKEDCRGSSRVLSPLISNASGSVPRLASLCLTALLSPRPPSDRPPFIEYDWESWGRGRSHPLLDPKILAGLLPPSLSKADRCRILQAVRSACTAASKGRASADCFPRSNDVLPPDDGAQNPHYSPCPSPKHQEWQLDEVQVTRRIFLDAAEERFEWVTIAGVPNLPIQWLGCSPGCLDFLEEDENEDEWLEHFGE